MSDVKQRKQKKRKEEEVQQPQKPEEPSKEVYKIANWMRQNVPTKKTKFLNHTVEYFTANKAIDQLLESPWSKSTKKDEDPLFTTRESVVEYLDTMLRFKIFHRARKIVVPENELKSKKKKDKDEKDTKKEPSKEEKKKEDEKEQEKAKEKALAAESSQAEGEQGEDKDKKNKKQGQGEKKKKKIRLDMHLEQVFLDGTDAYVWIYEPTPYYYYIFGFLVVIATIGVCLFPLWPSSVRQGVYYLSLAAAGFLVFILALAVIRLIVFCIIWGLTLGRHHLWLLPNLTEDVGFFASFWPLFKYDYKGDEDEKKKRSESSTKETSDSPKLPTSADEEPSSSKGKNDDNSETESQGSHKSEKDYYIVEHEEVDS